MHCLSRLIAGACCCYGVWLINNVIKLFYLRECIFMVTLWKGWFTHWNSRELVCVRACESFCWAPYAVLGGHGQWPVSVSCTTDKKESFRFAVSYVPQVLMFKNIPSLWNNAGGARVNLFSLFNGWDLSSFTVLHLYYNFWRYFGKWLRWREGSHNFLRCDNIFGSEREEDVAIWIASLRLPHWPFEDCTSAGRFSKFEEYAYCSFTQC